MTNKSYQIKHDFLFDCDYKFVTIPNVDDSLGFGLKLKVSDIINATSKNKFLALIEEAESIITIVDDSENFLNFQSKSFKNFLIGCTYLKLLELNYKVYLQN